MMTIKITKKLTASQTKHLRRRADMDHSDFHRVGRNEYCLTHEVPAEMERTQLHAIARRMMVLAGTTFRYEIQ